MIEISKTELIELLLFGFRYALGRRSAAVSSMSERLIKYWDLLPEFTREQIHIDIRHAIQHQISGDDCDVWEWEKVLALPSRTVFY